MTTDYPRKVSEEQVEEALRFRDKQGGAYNILFIEEVEEGKQAVLIPRKKRHDNVDG